MFKFTNFVTPGTIYHGTVSGGEGGDAAAEVSLKVYLETKVPGITTSDFETKQVNESSGVRGCFFHRVFCLPLLFAGTTSVC